MNHRLLIAAALAAAVIGCIAIALAAGAGPLDLIEPYEPPVGPEPLHGFYEPPVLEEPYGG